MTDQNPQPPDSEQWPVVIFNSGKTHAAWGHPGDAINRHKTFCGIHLEYFPDWSETVAGSQVTCKACLRSLTANQHHPRNARTLALGQEASQ